MKCSKIFKKNVKNRLVSERMCGERRGLRPWTLFWGQAGPKPPSRSLACYYLVTFNLFYEDYCDR